ncbi:MAG TPA: S8 family peptidase [Anaerolineae bacterium]|nr:S8 family peptidase [Anaerolineae bacterium]
MHHNTLINIPKSVNWGGRALNLLVALTLVVALLPVASAPTMPLRAQPILLQMAAQQPEATLGVIVQEAVKDDRLENMVAALGGKVTKDLRIINAFAAEMKASDALQLARADGVRWVSLDAPVAGAAGKPGPSAPKNYFLDTLRVRPVWDMGLQGQGIGVAVIDSGITKDPDFAVAGQSSSSRVLRQMSFSSNSPNVNDTYGHGTHVAGIVGGSGYDSGGLYSGIAPQVNLLSLKISDESGMAYESDTVSAMQWVLDNKATFNIRVVNLSINSTVEQSYHTSPLDAAAEILWFNGIVVVASAGNTLSSGGYYNTVNAAPANDPFIITVGASNEAFSTSPGDDVIALFSAYGVTMDGFSRPDIIAPGTAVISVLSKSSSWGTQYPLRVVGNGEYFLLSGTSMAAPMVAGAVALLLQDEPNLTPDQVKYRLLNASGRTLSIKVGTGKTAVTYTYPYLDVYAVVTGSTTQSANTGLVASQLLWSGTEPVTWGSVNWNSVNWNSVNWNSVNWNSVNWNSVNWNSAHWGP